MSDLRIATVSFEEEGLVITYVDPSTDVRAGGKVALSHQAFIDRDHDDYGEDYVLLLRQATRILRNALEDHAESEPWSPEEESDEDEEMGSR